MHENNDNPGIVMPSLKTNYLYKLFYGILNLLAPFLTTPYVSRVLGADGVGVVSFTQSYITIFSMFAALGTASYGMREIARCRNNPIEYSTKFWEIELITVYTTTVCLISWIVFSCFNSVYSVYLFAFSPFLLATIFDISWFYSGQEKVVYTVLWNSIFKIIGIIAVFCFVKQKDDLLKYILIQSILLMLGNMSMWIHLRKFLVGVSLKELKVLPHIKETLVYFVPTIASSIYIVLDKTLLGLITHDSYENGYYEQASKLISMEKTVVFIAVNSVMEARISFLFAENQIEEIKSKISNSIDYIFLLGVGFSFGIVATAKNFVPIFFGDGYDPVVKLLYLMSPLVLIIGISNCIGSHYYTPAGYRAKSSKYIIIGSMSNLLLNLCLIPKFQSEGAVVASIVAESVISFLYLLNCDGFLTFRIIGLKIYKKVFAGIVMTALVSIIGCIKTEYSVIRLLVQVVIGVVTYFLALIILKDNIVIDYLRLILQKIKHVY